MSASLTELTQKAQMLKAEGRHSEALDALKDIVDLAPKNVAVLHNYAAGLGDAGRNREAVEVLRGAFALGLNAPESWLVFARALSGIQEFERAKEAFFNLLHLKPLDHDAHRELAQLIWMQTGNRDKALIYLNKAIDENPNAGSLHIARAQVYGQTGEPETEYAIVKEAARLSGGDPHLEYVACNAALASEEFEEAVKHGRYAAETLVEENGAAAAYCNALLAIGDAKEALHVVDRLRERQPVNQLFIALQATAWRLQNDERYHEIMDYDSFVYASPLDTPSGWGSPEAYLDDLIEGLDQAHKFHSHPFFQSVRHGSQISSITGADNPAMRAFSEACLGPANRYMDRLSPGDGPVQSRNLGAFRLFSSWSISLPPKGFHVNHVHPEGWLSSACHLRAPNEESEEEKAGWLKFGEPGVTTSPQLKAEKYVKPEPGVMVVFPSYMWHGTNTFISGPARLTMAADFVPASA